MDKCKKNPRCLFVAISIMLAGIFGLWGNSRAENLYLAQESAASDFTNANTIYFMIPFAQIQIDGDKSDWETIASVLVDGLGDMDRRAAIEGADIDRVYIAHDRVFLYILITLDGPPVKDQHVQYNFEAMNNSFPGKPGENTGNMLAYAHFIYGNWSAGVHERSRHDENVDYPASYVGIGPDFIEWKVLLTDMGNMNNKYAWSLIGAYPWGNPNPDWDLYPVSDSTDAVVRMIYKDW